MQFLIFVLLNKAMCINRNCWISIILFFIFVSCVRTKKEYYETGEMKIEYEIKNNLKDGIYTEYYKNGQVKSKYNYCKGKLEGKGILFYKNNRIQTETNFRNGLQEGIVKAYFPDGSLKQLGHYKKGLVDGVTFSYYSNKKLDFYSIRRMDTVLYSIKFDSLGNVVDEGWTVSIFPQKTTIKINETYSAKIKVNGLLHEFNYLGIGVLDSICSFPKNLPDYKMNSNNEVVFTYTPQKKGIFYLNVLFFSHRKGELPKLGFHNWSKIEVVQ